MRNHPSASVHTGSLSMAALLYFCFAFSANAADSLFFTSPLSKTGYSGSHIARMGEDLPLWAPPADTVEEKAAPAATSTQAAICAGWFRGRQK